MNLTKEFQAILDRIQAKGFNPVVVRAETSPYFGDFILVLNLEPFTLSFVRDRSQGRVELAYKGREIDNKRLYEILAFDSRFTEHWKSANFDSWIDAFAEHLTGITEKIAGLC